MSYSNLQDLDAFAVNLAVRCAGQTEEARRLIGFCMMFKREMLESVGRLDERFGIGNFEDDDLCRRALARGWRLLIVKDAFVHHFGSQTFTAMGVDHGALLRANASIFEQKWSQFEQSPVAAADATSGRVSLCMIVRDSSRTLRACLQSVKPWVEEIIVVDTGSVDDTRQIAEKLGAKVLQFSVV